MDARKTSNFLEPMVPPGNTGRRGFSLLELLVTIGVISLLLGILVPSLLRVRFTNARTVCAASLRQMGLGVWSYAINNSATLPIHHDDKNDPFDTFVMCRLEDEELVNLGLVVPYVQEIGPFYCPSQDAVTSPSLGCNTPENRWVESDVANVAGISGGEIIGLAKPPKTKPGGPPEPPAGLNSSFAARTRAYKDEGLPSWKTFNHANKVIYSDFVGLDKSPGRGRFKKRISAPHGGEGCNRLFGNGSVQWADMGPLNNLRPVGPAAPNARELYEYYKLLDVLP
ncbi:MAG: hypothetical protein BWX88_01440 [Planctomycetes bacterium ADurb.Bin126]|nr:MAG: hypothetical protein BWX88_01440 [Planctomycetes bacterium ADurb.Bin126]